MILITILILFAACFNALMDLSSDGKLKPRFNKQNTWRNKWKNGHKAQGEKFLFSSTIFVFITDYWHLMQYFFHSSWQLAITIAFYSNQDVSFWRYAITFVIIKTLFSSLFELIYKKSN